MNDTTKGEPPINSAASNSLWVYPVACPPRFAGAPAAVETTRSYEMSVVPALPGGADVRVEFYGGAYSFWLDGERSRVYVSRFEHVSFTSEEARHTLLTLWHEVELMESPTEVERWLERRRGERPRV
jgi:hypothetical protein